MPGEPGYNFTPYVTFGIGVFNYDPFAMLTGQKYFLRPLNTEGQGSSLYPDRKPYGSMAFSIPLGFGFKYCINESINVGFEIVHRVTGTDYLDDVSSIYVDQNVLLQAKGAKAVEMAYRGDEIQGGLPYPNHGEQRGTPSEMDWYYFFGVNFEIKFSAFAHLFKGANGENSSALQITRCPRNVQQ